jgi:hypothetical protein
MVGIATSAAVIVIGLAVLAGLLANASGPTLTSAQYAKVYQEGDSMLGNSVAARWTISPGFDDDPTAEPCEQRINILLENSSEGFTAGTTIFADGTFVVSGRYDSPGPLKSAFDTARKTCSVTTSGTYRGAAWYETSLLVSTGVRPYVVLSYGNVVMVGSSVEGFDREALAQDMQAAIIDAAKP